MPVPVFHVPVFHPPPLTRYADRLKSPEYLLVHPRRSSMSASPEPTPTNPPRDDQPLESEKRLGKYRILRRIGRGGMGVVFEAEDTLLLRRVAIKVLSAAIAKHPDSLQRFLREARAAAKLSHPNVVAIHEVDQKNSLWFIVMELVSGGSIHDYLNQHGALPWPEATNLIAEACAGLIAAHREGLIHRDIKPANLMRTQEGHIKLVDFGLAKGNAEAATITTSGTVIGTPNYMSPEQWRAEPLNDLCDIYALGATYYTLLTGRPPHANLDSMQIMYACCIGETPDPVQVIPTLPTACTSIIQKAMAREPMDRFSSAQDMLLALQQLTHLSTPSELCPPDQQTSRSSSGRNSLYKLFSNTSLWTGRRLLVLCMIVLIFVGYPLWPSIMKPHAYQSPSATKRSNENWTPLFNGKDLDNWHPLKSPPGIWQIEEGMLVGRVTYSPVDTSSYLMTDLDDFQNFELRAELKITKSSNSGLFLRCDEDASLPRGLEAHLATSYCGDLHRTWAHDEMPLKSTTTPLNVAPDTWMTIHTTLTDNHIVIRINDQVTADVQEHWRVPKHGRIGIQVYGTDTVVHIRRLEIRSLP